ncbi:MAG: DUF3343 domain-containing protein [Andreesenia angusta]|nr:DUF3343 domain-containing protein [Andreesenia angusta]
MEKQKICVLTFNTTNYALDFEKKAKEEGIYTRLMPVPRNLSASCGTAAEIDYSFKDSIEEFCRSNNIEFDRIYELDVKKKESIIDKLFKKRR